jgi:hypothetical protein
MDAIRADEGQRGAARNRRKRSTVKKTGFPGMEKAAPGSTITKIVERTQRGNFTG